MSNWVVGDLQGCLSSFNRLLTAIDFDAGRDRLWLVGDLVNRGPDSLGVLRRVRGLGDAVVSVLGNHDLHLLAVAAGLRPASAGDTLQALLAAPDAGELLDWLARRPLIHREGDDILVHAGLAPEWTPDQALAAAAAVSAALADADARRDFLARMYGNQPDRWADAVDETGRWRYAVNSCTRMRYVDAGGRLLFRPKMAPDQAPAGAIPWFLAPHRRPAGLRVFFGHWSALGRVAWPEAGVWGLDTGCVWGRQLTAIRREDLKVVSVPTAPGDAAGNGGD